MLFNSFDFLIFFAVVFFLYWFVFNKSLRLQNLLLLASGYVFYSFWDYRFLVLLLFSTSVDYFAALKISKTRSDKYKKSWLFFAVCINLGLLCVFKYYDFFVSSFSKLLSLSGFNTSPALINIILPVGISFYTFHGLSYIIDVYRNKVHPTKNFAEYAVFVSFFPLLVAGPIERATHLLPQIQTKRVFDYSRGVDALRQILWGYFKKIVIADNCAGFSDIIFNNYGAYSGSTLVVGALFFAFQIYADFSGYTDIAIGVSRLLGIEIVQNFSFPYFSRSIAEFWRRWHISLTSWFRDYVYIPLGGNRVGTGRQVMNVLIVFLLSGLWHGANWTFLAWGFLHALFYLPGMLIRKKQIYPAVDIVRGVPHSLKIFLSIAATFCLTTFAWIFFRSENLLSAINYTGIIFSTSLFSIPEILPKKFLLLMAFFIFIEWQGRHDRYAIETAGLKWPVVVRWLFYFCLLLSIFLLRGTEQEFIYFQF